MVKDTSTGHCGTRFHRLLSPPPRYSDKYYFTNACPILVAALGGYLPRCAINSPLYPELKIEYPSIRRRFKADLCANRPMAHYRILRRACGLLAVIGLYGVISHITTMRRNEIGIRLALGASRQNVIGHVASDIDPGAGCRIGLAFAVAATSGAREHCSMGCGRVTH